MTTTPADALRAVIALDTYRDILDHLIAAPGAAREAAQGVEW